MGRTRDVRLLDCGAASAERAERPPLERRREDQAEAFVDVVRAGRHRSRAQAAAHRARARAGRRRRRSSQTRDRRGRSRVVEARRLAACGSAACRDRRRSRSGGGRPRSPTRALRAARSRRRVPGTVAGCGRRREGLADGRGRRSRSRRSCCRAPPRAVGRARRGRDAAPGLRRGRAARPGGLAGRRSPPPAGPSR